MVEHASDLLTVQPATVEDVGGVIGLIGRVFAEYGFVYDPAAEVPDLLAFARHYSGFRGAFWVIRDGPRIVGSVGVGRIDARTAELHRLYLDPGVRGRGLGRQLVERVLAWCRTEGLAGLVLWSDTRFEHAHRLYGQMGFRQAGERELPGDPNHTREYRYERTV
jgi:GNAT superfamily N-acetyltransferase